MFYNHSKPLCYISQIAEFLNYFLSVFVLFLDFLTFCFYQGDSWSVKHFYFIFVSLFFGFCFCVVFTKTLTDIIYFRRNINHWRCSLKELFWKISHEACNCIKIRLSEKRDSATGAFPWILRNFKKHLCGCFSLEWNCLTTASSYIGNKRFRYNKFNLLSLGVTFCIIVFQDYVTFNLVK